MLEPQRILPVAIGITPTVGCKVSVKMNRKHKRLTVFLTCPSTSLDSIVAHTEGPLCVGYASGIRCGRCQKIRILLRELIVCGPQEGGSKCVAHRLLFGAGVSDGPFNDIRI